MPDNSTTMEMDEEMRSMSREGTSITCPMHEPSNDSTCSSSSNGEEDTKMDTEKSRDESSDGKTTSKSKAPKARPHEGRKSQHSMDVVTLSQLEKKQPNKVKKVLDYYKDPRSRGSVHVCGLFLDGQCDYMKKFSGKVLNHLKCHGDSDISVVKVVDYLVPRDAMIHEYTTVSYSDLKNRHSKLAKRVLNLYKDLRNKNPRNIYLCGLCIGGKCEYISYNISRVMEHIARKHPNESISIIKVLGYPGQKLKTSHDYVAMTHAELHQRDPKLAQRAMDLYYGSNCMNRAHFCGLTLTGECDYASVQSNCVRSHIKHNHSRVKPPVSAYKITEYPPKRT